MITRELLDRLKFAMVHVDGNTFSSCGFTVTIVAVSENEVIVRCPFKALSTSSDIEEIVNAVYVICDVCLKMHREQLMRRLLAVRPDFEATREKIMTHLPANYRVTDIEELSGYGYHFDILSKKGRIISVFFDGSYDCMIYPTGEQFFGSVDMPIDEILSRLVRSPRRVTFCL